MRMNTERKSTPKSIRTREAIETAARELFAINGFQKTTVRDIGARAGIDPSMIIRYFGSKEALFARVAMPDLALPDVTDIDSATIGERMVRQFLLQWEAGPNAGGMQALLRSAGSNQEAADRLAQIFREQVLPAIARAGPPETAAIRAGLVATQLLGLSVARYITRLPPVVAMSHEDILRMIAPTIQRYATGDFCGSG